MTLTREKNLWSGSFLFLIPKGKGVAAIRIYVYNEIRINILRILARNNDV